MAFNFFGSSNYVAAGVGPFALAGAVFENGAVIEKAKPGFNINGLRVPNTAAALRGTGAATPSGARRPSLTKANHSKPSDTPARLHTRNT